MENILDAPESEHKILQYAGFWMRVAAALLDAMIIGVVEYILLRVFASMGAGEILPMLNLVLVWLYDAFFESSEQRATLGKKALGIIVVNEAGERISFARATGRHFGKYLSLFILCIGFVMVAFTSKKQGLHDIMAGTLVVKR